MPDGYVHNQSVGQIKRTLQSMNRKFILYYHNQILHDMLNHILRTLENIKVKIERNDKAIGKNQLAIQGMLLCSDDKNPLYADYIKHNKALLSQNNEMTRVQRVLLGFLKKYNETELLNDEDSIIDMYSIDNKQEIFNLTAKGIIPFNEYHPHYSDSEFVDKLIKHYKISENYELCDELAQLKTKLFH